MLWKSKIVNMTWLVRRIINIPMTSCSQGEPYNLSLRNCGLFTKNVSSCFQSVNRAITDTGHAQRVSEAADKADKTKHSSSDSSKDSLVQPPKRVLTAAEKRALEAEKRAALRQQRMRELEEDALKAQVVIAQVKAMSASSLETLAITSPDADKKTTTLDFDLLDGSPGGPRRSSGSSTKST